MSSATNFCPALSELSSHFIHSSRQEGLCRFHIIFFLFLQENIVCGYSLEVPLWGTSNEYHIREIRKISVIFGWINSSYVRSILFSALWFEPSSGHMWESQVLLTDGQVVFLRVLRFSPTFDERSARYKWNSLERAVKPKSNQCQVHTC